MNFTENEISLWLIRSDFWLKSTITRVDNERSREGFFTFIKEYIKIDTERWDDLKLDCFEYCLYRWGGGDYNLENHFSWCTYKYVQKNQSRLTRGKKQEQPPKYKKLKVENILLKAKYKRLEAENRSLILQNKSFKNELGY